jgi:hypothetical protein
MSDIKVILRKNTANLPEDQIKRIESALDKRQISPVSSDKETGLFLLYVMGDSLDTIAEQTNLPKDVVALTAAAYDWDAKCLEIKKYRNSDKLGEMQKDLINTLLTATYVSLKRDLALVIAGKKDPSEVLMIPKKIDGLKSLIDLFNFVNDPEKSNVPANATIVHAQNVQINQVSENTSESKIERFKRLRESKESK